MEKCIILKLILYKYQLTSKGLSPYLVTVTERVMVTIIEVTRGKTRGKEAETFGILSHSVPQLTLSQWV